MLGGRAGQLHEIIKALLRTISAAIPRRWRIGGSVWHRAKLGGSQDIDQVSLGYNQIAWRVCDDVGEATVVVAVQPERHSTHLCDEVPEEDDIFTPDHTGRNFDTEELRGENICVFGKRCLRAAAA
jgi:hypothetical protein